jgi:hypothetical protein
VLEVHPRDAAQQQIDRGSVINEYRGHAAGPRCDNRATRATYEKPD